MFRLKSDYINARPSRRPLKIFASDPMQARTPGNRITIDIPNEEVTPGPVGSRFEVIDYDGANGCFYPPVNLNHPTILIQNGLEPTESDPRFHQQMVYAVAMRTLENFERALGRRITFYRSEKKPRLRLFPHAFHGANAFFDPGLNAILFGYFCADRKDPGPNLPGQIVYTCLSHDVIVHELTHAVVNKLRRYFLEPTNPDVLAFHEGFSDIVALFQHFTFTEFLQDAIQKTRSQIQKGGQLVELAQQFGYATGANQALRSAINVDTNNLPKRLSPNVLEVHERGAILVAAVFEGYFKSYQKSIADLIRIATCGSGILTDGDLHPDLVNRIAKEASHIAQSIVNICIRAFDYMPPVDINFGDYLRALVTADYELYPDDGLGIRSAIIEGFRARGMYPDGVSSLAEEALVWEGAEIPDLDMSHIQMSIANEIFTDSIGLNLSYSTRWKTEMDSIKFIDIYSDKDHDDEKTGHAEDEKLIQNNRYDILTSRQMKEQLAQYLHKYAFDNSEALKLDRAHPIAVTGFHTIFRISEGGHVINELVFQLMQQDDSKESELGGIPMRGGTTVVANINGKVRYVIPKPISIDDKSAPAYSNAKLRFDLQKEYLNMLDMNDPIMSYGDKGDYSKRAKNRMKLASLHQGGIL